MAAARVAVSAESLSCSVCTEAFDKDTHCPRALSCGHTYCTECLLGIAKGRAMACPKCRRETVLPGPADASARDRVLLLIRNYQVLDIIDEAAQRRGQPDGQQQGDAVAAAAGAAAAAGDAMCEICGEDSAPHAATHMCVDCREVSAMRVAPHWLCTSACAC